MRLFSRSANRERVNGIFRPDRLFRKRKKKKIKKRFSVSYFVVSFCWLRSHHFSREIFTLHTTLDDKSIYDVMMASFEKREWIVLLQKLHASGFCSWSSVLRPRTLNLSTMKTGLGKIGPPQSLPMSCLPIQLWSLVGWIRSEVTGQVLKKKATHKMGKREPNFKICCVSQLFFCQSVFLV